VLQKLWDTSIEHKLARRRDIMTSWHHEFTPGNCQVIRHLRLTKVRLAPEAVGLEDYIHQRKAGV
jgi:hypothetical protein